MPIPKSQRKLRVLALVWGVVGLGLVGSMRIAVTPGTSPTSGAISTHSPTTTSSTADDSSGAVSSATSFFSSSTSPQPAPEPDDNRSSTTLVLIREAAEGDWPLVETITEVDADLFVAPTARGSGSGLSAADAAGIQRLNELVADSPPGGVIELVGDAGPYLVPETINLTAGGTSGHPVTIRGRIDGPRVELRGDRADPYDPAGKPGKALFRLASGADHLVFANLHCAQVGNGCFYVAAPITDLKITDVTASNVRRFFENGAGEGQADATIVGLTISNVEVSGFSKGAIRLAYDTHNVRITDVVGDSLQHDGDNFAIGVHLVDTVHDVVIERVTMDNARDTLHEYWNGDGFAAEVGVYDLELIDTSATGNTDAGYDIKASNVRLVNATAHDNKRNFRVWGQNVVLDECVGTDPELRGGTGTQAQIHLAEDAKVEVVGGSFIDGDPDTIVFDIDDRAHLVVRGAYVEHASAAKLSTVEATASVDLVEIVEITR